MTLAEQQMYGMTQADIRDQYDWYIGTMGREMTAISVMSDAQEVMFRDPERARKFINIAKFILVDEMRMNQKEAA